MGKQDLMGSDSLNVSSSERKKLLRTGKKILILNNDGKLVTNLNKQNIES